MNNSLSLNSTNSEKMGVVHQPSEAGHKVVSSACKLPNLLAAAHSGETQIA